MRRRGFIITLVLCVAAALAVVILRHCHPMVPESECSATYRHYAGQGGIDALFIKGLKMNDSLVADATVLRAADSSRWQWLLDDLGCEVDVSAQPGKRLMTIKTSPLHADGNRSEGCDLMIADPQRLEVVVCHYPAGRTKEIVSYYFNKILEE